jgi:hypothetical protein
MPGLLIFSLRLVVELLLAPVRALRKTLMPGHADERVAPVAPAEPPPPPPPPPRKRPPRQRATPRRAEPTRGQVAAMREAEREAETGGADSVGAQVHLDEPWPGYDEMGLEEVLTRLQGATDVELAVVRAYERGHEARQAILLAAGEEA